MTTIDPSVKQILQTENQSTIPSEFQENVYQNIQPINQPQKIFSFSENIDGQASSHTQYAQTTPKTEEPLLQKNLVEGNIWTPKSSNESITNVNARLDMLLRNADEALERSKNVNLAEVPGPATSTLKRSINMYSDGLTATDFEAYSIQPNATEFTKKNYARISENEPYVKSEQYESLENTKTVPRNYTLFPIKESHHSVHSNTNEIGAIYSDSQNKDVSFLKSGINNIEEKLNALGTIGSPSLADKILNINPTGTYHHKIEFSNDLYGDATPSFSTTNVIKARDLGTPHQESIKKSQIYTNGLPITSNTEVQNYQSELYTSPYRKTSYAYDTNPNDKTKQALRNIDELMNKHIFNNRPLTKSTVFSQTPRYTSPPRDGEAPKRNLYQSSILTKVGNPISDRKASDNDLYYDQYALPSEKAVKAGVYSHISSIRHTPAGGSLNDLGINHTSKYGNDVYSNIANGTYPYGNSVLNKYSSNYDNYPYSDKWSNKGSNLYGGYDQGYNASTKTPPRSRNDLENDYLPQNDKNYKIEFDFTKNYNQTSENTQNPEILNSADRKMKKLTLKAKPSEEKDYEKHPSVKKDFPAEHLFSEGDVPSHFDFHTQEHMFANEIGPRGDIQSDKAPYHENNLRGIQEENRTSRRNSQIQEPAIQNKHSTNQLKSGALEGDKDSRNVSARKEFHAEPRELEYAGDFAGEHEPEKTSQPVNKNIADDGKAWLMPHKIQSRIFESNETSFDFDNELNKYKEYLEATKSQPNQLKDSARSNPSTKKAQAQSHFWVIPSPPQSKSVNPVKTAVALFESVRKAQKKPIITHCFEKFNRKEEGIASQ